MDRFLDEQENQPPNKERPASPLNSLLYGDPKRHHPDLTPKTPTQEEIAAVVEMVQKVVDENQVVDFANKFSEIGPELHHHSTGGGGDCDSVAEAPKTVIGRHPTSCTMLSELSTNTQTPVDGGGDHHHRPHPTADSTTGEPQPKRQKTSPPDSLLTDSSKRLEHSNNCIVNSSHSSPLDSSQSLSSSSNKTLQEEQSEHRVSSTLGNLASSTTTSYSTSSVHSFSDSKIVNFGGESNATTTMSVTAEAVAH